MIEAMLPCPFCGRADLLSFEPYPVSGFLGVKCWACGCIGPHGRGHSVDALDQQREEAVAHWNARGGRDSSAIQWRAVWGVK
jgi:Lar family restriction alleviation protein